MKNVITLMLGLFLTTSAYADITGNIGYQNDYVFRGVNQTQSGGSLSTQVIVDSNGFYGGVSASLALLGDINVAEPDARAGFAGPNIIEQTIRQKLPRGFQRSEFLLEHGAIDMIIPRFEMRDTLGRVLAKFTNAQLAS
mgnify:CR=1 FL=1